MRRLPLLLSTLLVATLLAALGSPAADATYDVRTGADDRPARRASAVALQLAPSRVTVYGNGMVEASGLLASVTPPRRGRAVTFQQRVDGAWRTLATTRTNASGRAYRPLGAVTTTGAWDYRVTVAGNTAFRPATSATRTLRATPSTQCSADPAPVDAAATGEAHCLLQRLDRWRADRLMAVGQQVNISRFEDWDAPLRGITPAVVGFDLEELDRAATAEYPYVDANVQGLLDRAAAGAVLVASWHATNPFTGEPYGSARRPLEVLLPSTTRTPAQQVVHDAFWADWDRKLALLRRFQDGDSDADGDDGPLDGERTAVVVRPFHEVNGDFFWWGQPSKTTYRRLWAELQRRTAAAGVHNVLWAYSGNRKTVSTKDPGAWVPSRVDLGGLDSYDPETGRGNATDVLGLEGYAAIDRRPAVSRMALTEVGPHTSRDGSWNPSVITRTVRAAGVSPLWAMLWFDDAGYAQAGRKQITSLQGGRAWLASCPNALCVLR